MPSNFDIKDQISSAISQALNWIFIKYPQRTGLGVVLGVVLKEGINIALQYEKVNIELSMLLCVCAGILIMHIPTIFSKPIKNDEIEAAIYYFKKVQKAGNFSESEKRQQWQTLIELIYKKVSDQPEGQEDTEDSESDTVTAKTTNE